MAFDSYFVNREAVPEDRSPPASLSEEIGDWSFTSAKASVLCVTISAHILLATSIT